MVDHKRLDALTEPRRALRGEADRCRRRQAAPLDRPRRHVRPAHRTTPRPPNSRDIHRTKDPDEQRAWAALRAGEPERAMAHYHSRGQLHLPDTRDQAASTPSKLGRAHRDPRYPRGRADRRRLQQGDRPAQRPRPTPPRRTRRTRTPRDPAARRPLRPTRRRPDRLHRPAPPPGPAAGRERHPRPSQRHPRTRR